MATAERPPIQVFLDQIDERTTADELPSDELWAESIAIEEHAERLRGALKSARAKLINESATSYDGDMATVTREEIDAKLEAVEARTETKLAGIDGKIDRLGDQLVRVSADISAFKWWLVGAALTVIFGIGALNYTLLGNMVAAFESGKNTATSLTQATEELKRTQEQLKGLAQNLSGAATCAPDMIRDANGVCRVPSVVK